MNKKLFIKRLGISLLWVLAPVAVVSVLVWLCGIFGDKNVATALVLIAAFAVFKDALRDGWNIWTNWLKGNDGNPD